MTIYYQCSTCDKEIADESVENIPCVKECPHCGETLVLFIMTGDETDDVVEFLQGKD